MGTLAIRATRSCDFPTQVICVAVLTRTDFGAFRVVICILIERDSMRRVSVAENVAATATVVLAGEEAEVLLTCGVVAKVGFGIRLQRENQLAKNSTIRNRYCEKPVGFGREHMQGKARLMENSAGHERF